MNINNRFNLGQIVYLITDVDQLERIVTAITVRGNITLSYELSCGTVSSWHYDFEMASEVDIKKQLSYG